MSAAGPDIRDIRPPYWIALDWRILALGAAGIVLLLVLLSRLWCWYRAPPAADPAGTRARATGGDPDADRRPGTRAPSRRPSRMSCGCVEERFAVQATHLTTTEFLRACLSEVGETLRVHRAGAGRLPEVLRPGEVRALDLDGGQMQEMLASARHFIVTTATAAPAPGGVAPEQNNVPIRQS